MDVLNDSSMRHAADKGAPARRSDHRGRRGPRQAIVVRMLDEQATSEHRRMTVP